MVYADKEKRAVTLRARIERSKAFVDEIRARTTCEKCGAQPIDWHREVHVERPWWRVKNLRANGCSIERIQREIDACEALCRRCHMQEDGRMAKFVHQAKTRDRTKLIRPCFICEKPYKPLRRGMCNPCYMRWWKTTPVTTFCSLCDRPSKPLSKGMCKNCYEKLRRRKKRAEERERAGTHR